MNLRENKNNESLGASGRTLNNDCGRTSALHGKNLRTHMVRAAIAGDSKR